MAANFSAVFAALKPLLAKYADRLAVKEDASSEYTLVTKSASPFPRHKGQPLYFGSVRLGKAYVSYDLVPIYICPALTKSISPALKQVMTILPSVIRAGYRGGYRIHVIFSDGSEKTIDFREWPQGPIFEPLKNPDYFQRFFLDEGTVAWPKGADVAPETLYEARGIDEEAA